MRDAFINALNTQKITAEWVNDLSENLVNVYTPGYREKKFTFKTFLDGSIANTHLRNVGQGKSSPGTSDENIYLEVLLTLHGDRLFQYNLEVLHLLQY